MQIGKNKDSLINTGKMIPAIWREELVKILTTNYHDQSEKDKRFFDAYGKVFDNEFLVVVSYVHAQDPSLSPISLFISSPIQENDKKMKDALNSMTDLVGLIFDDIFNTDDWNDYVILWTENKIDGFDFNYKITRENISLTLQTQEFLDKNGEI